MADEITMTKIGGETGLATVLDSDTVGTKVGGTIGLIKKEGDALSYSSDGKSWTPLSGGGSGGGGAFDLVKVKDEVEMVPEVKIEPGKLNAITREYFLEHIFDYRKNEEFIYKGDKPVVIDFWATWCGPCMRLLPVMEKLAETYKDQVIFLKVNADKEKELCGMFNVVALPTLFFIPVGGKPIIEVGATPEKYVKIIETQLLNKQL